MEKYEDRVVPEDKRYTACDLPGMYMRCTTCGQLSSNLSSHYAKPSGMCDDCYERLLKPLPIVGESKQR
jgi:hypothetical protein